MAYHDKLVYARLVREWLNSEWMRLDKGNGAETGPFTPTEMKSISPKSKHTLFTYVPLPLHAY